MGMTMTQKILAKAAGLESVQPGQLIEAKLDLVLGNDITTPVAITEFEKAGFTQIFDKDKIAIVLDHYTPCKDIKSAQLCKQAREFAKKHDLSVVTVPNVNCNMKKKDAVSGNIQAWSIGPQEFLRLIMDSEYVITDSFHCTVFSLIFNKEIYCFDRENSGAPMNSRLKSLLGYCGIDNRFVKIDYVPKCDVSECIDY